MDELKDDVMHIVTGTDVRIETGVVQFDDD
jgi:hypothetical protein